MMNFVFAGLVIAAYVMGMVVGRWIGKGAQAKTFEPTQETWLELEKYKWVTPNAYAVHEFEMEIRAAEEAETNPEAGADCTETNTDVLKSFSDALEALREIDISVPDADDPETEPPYDGRESVAEDAETNPEVGADCTDADEKCTDAEGLCPEAGADCTDADEKCTEAEEVAELDLTAAPPMDGGPVGFADPLPPADENAEEAEAGRQNPKPMGKRRKKSVAFPHRDELTDLELIAFDKAMIRGAFDPEAGSGCWIWPGAMNGSTPQETITIQGHRIRTSVAWLMYCAANGRTEVRTMEHVCRNKKCVNPAHLKIWVPVAPGAREKTGGGV